MYLRPFEPLLGPGHVCAGSLLVLAPHPDDEVIGCGGLIAAHRDRGLAVTVVVMTDGSRGDLGRDAGAAYALQRQSETREALRRLGGADVVFLAHEDGRLAHAPGAADGVRRVLDELRPGQVVFPSPFEVHPDHRATALHALAAIGAARSSSRLLACEIGAFMPANFLFDVTPYMARKLDALAAYESQMLHQDLVAKVTALNRARTVNIDDGKVQYAEAYARIEPAEAERYFTLAGEMVRLVDAMHPHF